MLYIVLCCRDYFHGSCHESFVLMEFGSQPDVDGSLQVHFNELKNKLLQKLLDIDCTFMEVSSTSWITFVSGGKLNFTSLNIN